MRRFGEARETIDSGTGPLADRPLADRVQGDDVPRAGGPGRGPGRAQGRGLRPVEPTALVAFVGVYLLISCGPSTTQQRDLLLLRLYAERVRRQHRPLWGMTMAQARCPEGRHSERADLRGGGGKDFRGATSRGTRRRTAPCPPRSRAGLRRPERGGDPGGRARRGAHAPPTKDAYLGAYYQHQLARIYILVNEPEKALDNLEPLLKIPYYLSSDG